MTGVSTTSQKNANNWQIIPQHLMHGKNLTRRVTKYNVLLLSQSCYNMVINSALLQLRELDEISNL